MRKGKKNDQSWEDEIQTLYATLILAELGREKALWQNRFNFVLPKIKELQKQSKKYVSVVFPCFSMFAICNSSHDSAS